jgi:predicted kinase
MPQSSPEQPVLIIVTGLPATGKSTLAEALRDQLGLPLFTKDHFKELLHDVLDRRYETLTREESREIGAQAIALLIDIASELLRARVSVVIEANFVPWYAPADLAPLIDLADVRQVHCTLPDSLVLDRYRKRAQQGVRHPVHLDEDALGELEERIEAGGGRPLPINARLLQVDTTDGFRPGIDEVVAFCRP